MRLIMIPEEHKHFLDWLAGGVLGAVFVAWLPPVATLLTIIWMAIRIIETRTFRAFCYLLKKMFKRNR